MNMVMEELEFSEPTLVSINLPEAQLKNLDVSILRLDEIHPIISGNKIFKLNYFLKDALQSQHKTILTFGGAYSNHLAATAFAGRKLGLTTIGVVRGEESGHLSHTLQFCKHNEMKLHFITRSEYKNIDSDIFLNKIQQKCGEHILIPEGGYSKKGADGAALIYQYCAGKNFTHVCLAVGTATTFAGIVQASEPDTKVIGVSVLKKMTDFEKRMNFLIGDSHKKYSIINDYHFGGYAKKNNELISFINQFYNNYKIPLDFVYTGKMMFGIVDLIKKDYFPQGSKILCIHTGGLQGNKSLPNGTLIF